MSDAIEISVSDVNDVEAHVFARYVVAELDGVQLAGSKPLVLRGTVRGPYSTQARTLPAEVKFRDLGPQQPGLAEAIVPDPCMWLPELPQLYQVDVEALRGERIIAEYHGQLGLKRAKPRRGGIAFPG
jgi:hypothetical protein